MRPYHEWVLPRSSLRLTRPRPSSLGVRLALPILLAAAVSLGGCRRPTPTSAIKQPESHFVRGRVVALQPGSVVLNHEAIPGFMAPMTMTYALADPSVASELHPGDRITATLLNDRDASGPTHLRLFDIDVIAQASPDYKPVVQYHVPSPGEALADFTLLNQSGKKISLRQFRGKVLLLTFIYTRCPLADYCPRMSHNFAQIDGALAADPALYAKTHLLTISFDPAYDTPAVLRSYGGAYTGRYSQETFVHWDFAAPSAAELPKMEQWFDVGVTPMPNPASAGSGALQHSLATVIIGRDGTVRAFYPTNDWTVGEALRIIRAAAV